MEEDVAARKSRRGSGLWRKPMEEKRAGWKDGVGVCCVKGEKIIFGGGEGVELERSGV
jgi:hypothetical protein